MQNPLTPLSDDEAAGPSSSAPKRKSPSLDAKEEEDEDEEPVRKRSRREATKSGSARAKAEPRSDQNDVPVNEEPQKSSQFKSEPKPDISQRSQAAAAETQTRPADKASDDLVKNDEDDEVSEEEDEDDEEEEEEEEDESEAEEKPSAAAKAKPKVQSKLLGAIASNPGDPYPDWKPGEPVPYAALCTTFSLVEMTTKRLVISAHCSLFLRQVLRLTPDDLLPTVQLMINKLAADYAGVELGIGESLIMKAIGQATGRDLKIIKADQAEIGDLGLVAAKSRSTQPTMFKPKALTVRGVLNSLMGIATAQGTGSQQNKIDGIKKLLSAADAAHAGKGSKGIDITKDKGGASEAKYIIRFLEGKLRLGLAEKTVIVALAHAMVMHEAEQDGKKAPTTERLAEGEAILKSVFR